MKTFLTITASMMLATGGPALAQEATPLTPITQMVAAFNKGDVAAAKATHIAAPSIIDEPIAPYVWTGPTAFDTWVAALRKSEAAEGKTGGIVYVGAPTRQTITGDSGYIVVPSAYTFRQGGKKMRETGTMTFAVTKVGTDWKIAAWAWTSPEAVLVQ